MKVNLEKRDDSAIQVNLGSNRASVLTMCVLRPGNNNYYLPRKCKIHNVADNENSITCEFYCEQEDVRCDLELTRHNYGYKGFIRASGTGQAIVRLILELPKDNNSKPFVPAFMYNHNKGGNSNAATYPRLLESGSEFNRTKPWISEEWLIRADRSSHCLTSIIGQNHSYALVGKDVCIYADGTVAEKNGLGIRSGNPQQLSFSLGFRNAPYTYSDVPAQNYIDRPEGFVNLDNGQISSEFSLLLLENKSFHNAAAKLQRISYACFNDTIDCSSSIKKAITEIASALVEYGYSQKAKNFYTTIHDDRDKANEDRFFCSGWSGGIQAAFPLLRAGHQLGVNKWIDCARLVISNLADNAISQKSNMFYENYDLLNNTWSVNGWWHGDMDEIGHSGYVNGQVCYYMLAAYQLEQENGNKQPNWYDSAKKVLDHIAAAQAANGQFGFTYSKDNGSILDESGFCGCWFVPAFAMLYKLSNEKQYLECCEEAMKFYRPFVEEFNVYGGPHDAYKSPDSEAIIAWINAARILHEITNNQTYLNDLIVGLDYEFSWRFAYNVHNEVEPLKSMKWCSRGGSVTSVNNSHIHPMGSAIAESILYAAEQTGDQYYWSRLNDTVRWTLKAYLHHDGQYGWGKKGLINERFCYTDSLLTERFADGSPASTWFCGHSWASGSVLEGLTGTIFELLDSHPEILTKKN